MRLTIRLRYDYRMKAGARMDFPTTKPPPPNTRARRDEGSAWCGRGPREGELDRQSDARRQIRYRYRYRFRCIL
jgi:hypothetical protein